MTLFNRLPPSPDPVEVADPVAAFRFAHDDRDQACAVLLLQPVGSSAPAATMWSRACGSPVEAEALIARLDEQGDGAGFFGRQLLLLGPATLDGAADAALAAEHARVASQEADALEEAAALSRVHSYASDKKGWFYLTLKRASSDESDWSIAFRGRAERERLRDWLRWQGDRFAEFLDYADEHGGEALETRLVDEMFETEARVKKAGRSAGGTRPLRMWRGA